MYITIGMVMSALVLETFFILDTLVLTSGSLYVCTYARNSNIFTIIMSEIKIQN
jgi:hypothetical protein